MTDLAQRLARSNRLFWRKPRPTMQSAPALEEPKELFTSIRLMVRNANCSTNLSRAVVQFVRHCSDDSEESEVDTHGVLLGGRISVRSTRTHEVKQHLLKQASRLDERNQTDLALDIIFDQIDEMLLAGLFDDVNQLLAATTTSDYSVELLLGVLTATLPAKDQLSERPHFLSRVKAALEARGKATDLLLAGLD